MYTYTWYQWLAFFYVYCFLGWIFESTYVSLKQKRLVNRGFLRLPMLPLYGSGAVMMLWVSPYRLQSQGCILLTASSGPKLLKNLEREGIPAALIGRTRTAIGREIYSGEVHSFLDRPKPDEMDKMKDLQKSH